jgi:bifunctional DNA-binding transcriptional regulator/antitoxin component of YhaV-PrlF toxin-antitoxin module
MKMTDYKKYALGQVENFLYDAMSSGATPQEIYDAIKGVVEDNYYTYKKCTAEAYELLGLLNGNGEGHIAPKAKLVIPPITCDKEDTSPECKKSWNDFWEENYYPEEHQQYTDEELNAMCDAATSAKKGKENKWVIPVDDDYNITFPEDLLKQTGWKEGDVLEWIDQGDGSFKMIKKETKPSWIKGNEIARVKTYQEMLDDGWEMTADGFWIKEN